MLALPEGLVRAIVLAWCSWACAMMMMTAGCAAFSVQSPPPVHLARDVELPGVEAIATSQSNPVSCWAAAAATVDRFYRGSLTEEEFVARVQRATTRPGGSSTEREVEAATRSEVLFALCPSFDREQARREAAAIVDRDGSIQTDAIISRLGAELLNEAKGLPAHEIPNALLDGDPVIIGFVPHTAGMVYDAAATRRLGGQSPADFPGAGHVGVIVGAKMIVVEELPAGEPWRLEVQRKKPTVRAEPLTYTVLDPWDGALHTLPAERLVGSLRFVTTRPHACVSLRGFAERMRRPLNLQGSGSLIDRVTEWIKR